MTDTVAQTTSALARRRLDTTSPAARAAVRRRYRAEDRFKAWLEARGSTPAAPFFAYVTLVTPRLPFDPPPEFQNKFMDTVVPIQRLEKLVQLWIPFARQFALYHEFEQPLKVLHRIAGEAYLETHLCFFGERTRALASFRCRSASTASAST